MILTSRYLYNQRVNLIANEAGQTTEYRPVYRKQLKAYRGIDNVFEFKILNADQKPIDLTAYSAKFVIFDSEKNMIVNRDITILDDGSTRSTKGLCKVTLSDNDTLNIKEQYLSYTVYVIDTDGNNVLTYADSHFGSAGTIYLSDEAFPGPSLTKSVSSFTEDNNAWYSSVIDAQPGINGNEALHTAAVYPESYVGSVVVQVTLDNQVTQQTNWVDIETITFTGSESEPTPVNFNGVYSFIRFKAEADPSNKISKILVRN